MKLMCLDVQPATFEEDLNLKQLTCVFECVLRTHFSMEPLVAYVSPDETVTIEK